MNYPILGGEYCTNVPLDNLNRELRVGYTGYGKKKNGVDPHKWQMTGKSYIGCIPFLMDHVAHHYLNITVPPTNMDPAKNLAILMVYLEVS